MAQKPIQIPDDIAAKYDQPDQTSKFQEVLGKVISLPAAAFPKHKDVERGPKGRPKKSEN